MELLLGRSQFRGLLSDCLLKTYKLIFLLISMPTWRNQPKGFNHHVERKQADVAEWLTHQIGDLGLSGLTGSNPVVGVFSTTHDKRLTFNTANVLF